MQIYSATFFYQAIVCYRKISLPRQATQRTINTEGACRIIVIINFYLFSNKRSKIIPYINN
jgi:hypothetical protein